MNAILSKVSSTEPSLSYLRGSEPFLTNFMLFFLSLSYLRGSELLNVISAVSLVSLSYLRGSEQASTQCCINRVLSKLPTRQ